MLKDKALELSNSGKRLFKLSPSEDDISRAIVIRSRVSDDRQ
jgi:hypothetical protein